MQQPDATIHIRKYSTGIMVEDEIEDIHVPLSTELIPDEYEHTDNNSGLVVVLSSSFSSSEYDKHCLIEALSQQGYNILEENIFTISSKNRVLRDLQSVAQRDTTKNTCLLVIFIGRYWKDGVFLADEDDSILSCKDIWSNFTGNKCPFFKNKAKVFIFQAIKLFDLIQHDNTRSLRQMDNVPINAYEVPAEADILIIYNTVEGQNSPLEGFIPQFCKKMGCIGQREDIINLVAHSDSGAEKRPLVISTLTRKFFIQSSHLRGYHFELVQCHEKVGHGVSKLYEIVGEVDSKLKEDGTLRQNIPMDVSDSSTPQIVGRKNRNQQNRSNVSTKTFKVRPPWKY